MNTQHKLTAFPVSLARQAMRENLRPACVILRRGFRGNRAVRRLFALCFAPVVNPNGRVSRYAPTSAAWIAYARRDPVGAEFCAAEFIRALRLESQHRPCGGFSHAKSI